MTVSRARCPLCFIAHTFSIDRGLKIFEEITYLGEYYLTNAEIEVLQTHADAIVKHVPEGCRLLELGSGCVGTAPTLAAGTRPSTRCLVDF